MNINNNIVSLLQIIDEILMSLGNMVVKLNRGQIKLEDERA